MANDHTFISIVEEKSLLSSSHLSDAERSSRLVLDLDALLHQLEEVISTQWSSKV